MQDNLTATTAKDPNSGNEDPNAEGNEQPQAEEAAQLRQTAAEKAASKRDPIFMSPPMSKKAQKILAAVSTYLKGKYEEFASQKQAVEGDPKSADTAGNKPRVSALGGGEDSALQVLQEAVKGLSLEKARELLEAAKSVAITPANAGPESRLSQELPRIHAFEVETKLRGMLEGLMLPVAELGRENAERLLGMQRFLDRVRQGQQDINDRLENTSKLRDVIKECQQNTRQWRADAHQEIDNAAAKMAEVKALVQTHEDKIAKLNDDRKVYENRGDQLRKDIREFESLCIDISHANKAKVDELKGDYTLQINGLLEEVDEVRRQNLDLRRQVKFSKDIHNRIQGQVAWQKRTLDELLVTTDDLPVFKNQLIATDNYLAKVLPIKMHNAIYESSLVISKHNRESKLGLLEYTDQVFDDIMDEQRDDGFRLDKNRYRMPELKPAIENLKAVLSMQEPERPPSIVNNVSKPEQPKEVPGPRTAAASPVPPSSQSRSPPPGSEGRQQPSPPPAGSQFPIPANTMIHIEFTKPQLSFLSRKIGKRLLRDGKYLDGLADALEGFEPENAVTTDEELSDMEEGKVAEKALAAPVKQVSEQGRDDEKAEIKQGNGSRLSNVGESPKERKRQRSPGLEDANQETPTIKSMLKDGGKATGPSQVRFEEDSSSDKPPRKQSPPPQVLAPGRTSPQERHTSIDARSRSPSPQVEHVPHEGASQGVQRLYTQVKIKGEEAPPKTLKTKETSIVSSQKGSDEPRRRRQARAAAPDTSAAIEKLQMQVDELKDQIKYLGFKVKRALQLQEGSQNTQGSAGPDEANVNDQVAKMLEGYKEDEERKLERRLQSMKEEQMLSITSEPLAPVVNPDEFVTHGEFHEVKKEMAELRSVVKDVRSKYFNQMNGQGFQAISKQGKGANEEVHESTIKGLLKRADEVFEHVELLKLEQKKELKRLQRQNFMTNADYNKSSQAINEVIQKVDLLNKRVILSDTSVATIFKMLRIQYALSHQDELDRQDMSLMGLRDINGGGQTPGKNFISQMDSNMSDQDLDQQSLDDSVIQTPKRQNAQNTGQEKLENMKALLLQGATNTAGQSILSVDRNCIQCSEKGAYHKQLPTLLKGFKMACLSYKPSQVIFDQKSFERNQLVEAQGHILYLALQQLKHLDFGQVEKTLLGEAARELEDSMRAQEDYSKHDESRPNLVHSRPQLGVSRILRDNSMQLSPSLPDDIFKQHPNILSIETDKLNQSNIMNRNPSIESIEYIGALRGHPRQPNDQSFDISILSANKTNEASMSILREPQSNTKMISFSKSKEYARLAAQIPAVLNIENGRKVLNQNDLVNVGITGGGNTSQDKYQKNIQHLKSYQKQLKQWRQLSAHKTDQEVAEGDAAKLKQRNILYSQTNRKSLNMTTVPQQVDMSIAHNPLKSSGIFDNTSRRDVTPIQKRQIGSKHINAHMMNMLNENPMTPGSVNQAILKNPKRLAAMGLGLGIGQYDQINQILTPKAENASSTNPLSRAFDQERTVDQCLSSRPIRFNRLGGIAGNSLALAGGGGRGGMLSSLAQLDQQAGLAQKASLPNLGMNYQINSRKALAGLQASPSTARIPRGLLAKVPQGYYNQPERAIHLLPNNQQEFNRTDASMGTQKGANDPPGYHNQPLEPTQYTLSSGGTADGTVPSLQTRTTNRNQRRPDFNLPQGLYTPNNSTGDASYQYQ